MSARGWIPGRKLAVLVTAFLAAAPLHAVEVRLFTNNDIFVNESIQDDFYSFGARIEIETRDWTLRLTENGFTDREAELRFDETYFTLGRTLPLQRWSLWLEFGVLKVGEGLLGQGAQNTIHDWIGVDQVFLPYIEEEKTRLHLAFEAGRPFSLGRRLFVGPQFGLRTSVGFKSNALIGARGVWRPRRNLELDVTLGARLTETSFEFLEPVLEEAGPAAMVELELPLGFVFRWSFNRYGTEREHVAIGYRFTIGNNPHRGREYDWRPLGDLP